MPTKAFRAPLTPKVAECISRHKASLQDILFALFHDSVCAGARQVVINTRAVADVTWLSITDDGSEIFASSESSLFKIQLPRQLSICNLWHRGAVVESKNLSLEIAPENFPVNRDVQMQFSSVERGTKISFPIVKNEITELLRVIKCIATYSPIPLIFNGSKFNKQNNRVLTQV